MFRCHDQEISLTHSEVTNPEMEINGKVQTGEHESHGGALNQNSDVALGDIITFRLPAQLRC